jgi:hypothetical protein
MKPPKELPPPPKLNFDINLAKDVVCDNCKNYTFVEVILFKDVPAMVDPNGKGGLLPIPTIACNSCGNVNDRFLPDHMKKKGGTNIVDAGSTGFSLKLEK